MAHTAELEKMLYQSQSNHTSSTRMDAMSLAEMENLRRYQLQAQAANAVGKKPMQHEAHNRRGKNHWFNGGR